MVLTPTKSKKGQTVERKVTPESHTTKKQICAPKNTKETSIKKKTAKAEEKN